MPRARSMLGALFFIMAAALLYTSLPLAWGGGDAPDGTRYKLSPTQLSHVLKPHQTVSPVENCRIHGAETPMERCRMGSGGEEAFLEFQLVRPLILAGTVFCLLAALLALVPGISSRLRLIVGAPTMIIPPTAMILFATTALPALEGLTGTNFGLAATRGTMQLLLAIALSLGATGLLMQPRARIAPAFAAIGALLILPFLGLRFGGWPGVAVGFGIAMGVLVAGLRPARVVGSAV